MGVTQTHIFEADALRRAVSTVVRGFGSEQREVDLVTENLVQANLTGHDSHGIGMLPRYVEAYQEGGLKPNAHLSVKLDSGAMLSLDGQAGFGQVIGHEAMELGISRAKQHGSCIMALGNAHHLCRIGAWAEMAVAENLISIHFVNAVSRPIVAPWWGTDARFGTNPFCVGVPVPGGEPLLLDLATSAIAQGKTRVAHNKREQLKPGLMIDDKGRETTDPIYGVKQPYGALRTFGEHKGYGLAVVCELLGGALSAGLTTRAPADGKRRILNGMLTIIIDPAKLGDMNMVGQEMTAFIDWVKSSPPVAGANSVLIAGDVERQMRSSRSAQGVPVDDNTWQDLLAGASKLGVDPDLVQRQASGG